MTPAAARGRLEYLTYWTNDLDWIAANRGDFIPERRA